MKLRGKIGSVPFEAKVPRLNGVNRDHYYFILELDGALLSRASANKCFGVSRRSYKRAEADLRAFLKALNATIESEED